MLDGQGRFPLSLPFGQTLSLEPVFQVLVDEDDIQYYPSVKNCFDIFGHGPAPCYLELQT